MAAVSGDEPSANAVPAEIYTLSTRMLIKLHGRHSSDAPATSPTWPGHSPNAGAVTIA